jgi:PTH2 family peptidyl-tRNA hydrolase
MLRLGTDMTRKSLDTFLSLYLAPKGVKMVVLVRTDLQMGKGKVAAQVAHAAVSAVLEVMEGRREWRAWLEQWLSEGQPKVVLKVTSQSELIERCRKASSAGLPCVEIRDAGRTQVEPNTLTCVAIGPGPEELIDSITGDLKLL